MRAFTQSPDWMLKLPSSSALLAPLRLMAIMSASILVSAKVAGFARPFVRPAARLHTPTQRSVQLVPHCTLVVDAFSAAGGGAPALLLYESRTVNQFRCQREARVAARIKPSSPWHFRRVTQAGHDLLLSLLLCGLRQIASVSDARIAPAWVVWRRRRWQGVCWIASGSASTLPLSQTMIPTSSKRRLSFSHNR